MEASMQMLACVAQVGGTPCRVTCSWLLAMLSKRMFLSRFWCAMVSHSRKRRSRLRSIGSAPARRSYTVGVTRCVHGQLR